MAHPHLPFSQPTPTSRETAEDGSEDDEATPTVQQTSSSSQAARPMPRFAPSWSRQQSVAARRQQQWSSASSQPQASASARRFLVHTNSSSSSVGANRWTHGPQQKQHAEKTDDVIEEGSSPLREMLDVQGEQEAAAEPVAAAEAGPEAASEAEMEGPKTAFAHVPSSLARPTQWARRRRRPRRPQDDIEEARSSSPVGEDSGTDGEAEGQDTDGDDGLASADIGTTRLAQQDVHTLHLTHDRLGSRTASRAYTAGPATRLFSSAQPFKRRRLFASPGLIASSPSATFSDSGEERDSHGNSTDDGIVDDERLDEEGMGSDDDALLEDAEQEHRDYDEDENDFLYSRRPTRRGLARSARETDTHDMQLDPFQRARLFLPQVTGHRAEDDGDEADLDAAEDGDRRMDEASRTETSGAAHRENDWANDERQPPADFFSPQKRTKRRRRRRRPQSETATTGKLASGAVDEQYMPGGLAAELRDWLVQIKNGSSVQSTGKRSVAAEQVTATAGTSMCLVQGRWREPEAAGAAETGQVTTSYCRLLLVGDGRAAQGSVAVGDVIALAPPVWEVDVGGQTWTVASDWSRVRGQVG